MSRSVDDLGQGSLPHGLSSSDNVVGGHNWGGISLDNGLGSDVAHNWTGNNGIMSPSGISQVGIGQVVVGQVVVAEGGVAKGGVAEGRWEHGDLSLLPSGTGECLLVGNGVSSLGLDHLRSVLDGRGGHQVGNEWGGLDWSWAEGKVVGGNTEAIMSGGVFHTNFLTVGVDVGVRATNVSGGVTDGRVGLAGVGVAVRGLAELVLGVVLGLGGKRSDNVLLDDGGSAANDDGEVVTSPDSVVEEDLGIGAGSGHHGEKNDESLHD